MRSKAIRFHNDKNSIKYLGNNNCYINILSNLLYITLCSHHMRRNKVF